MKPMNWRKSCPAEEIPLDTVETVETRGDIFSVPLRISFSPKGLDGKNSCRRDLTLTRR